MATTAKYNQFERKRVPLHEYVLTSIRHFSTKPALIDDKLNKRYTFEDVCVYVTKFATALHKRGISCGDHVYIHLPNCIEYPVVLLAISSLGAVAVPVNSQMTQAELQRLVNILEPTAFITCEGEALRTVELHNKTCAKLKNIIVVGSSDKHESYQTLVDQETSVDVGPVQIDPDSVVWLGFTSGTTGKPKGVMHSHSTLVSYVSWRRNLVNDGSEQRFMTGYPFFGVGGTFSLMYAFVCGFTHVVVPFCAPPTHILPLINKYQITSVNGPTYFASKTCDYIKINNLDIPLSLHSWSYGGAMSPDNLPGLLKEYTGVKVTVEVYGCTEATAVALNFGSSPQGSVGKITPAYKAKICNQSTGDTLGPQEIGEICVKGCHIMMGYYQNEEATNQAFDAEGWFHTGDIGYLDKEDNLFVAGRHKDILKVYSQVVSPAELESVLLEHPAVCDAAVVGAPTSGVNDLPCAFVVLKAGHTATEQDMCDYIAANMAPHKHLTAGVRFVKSFARNAMGKIMKNTLVETLTQNN